MSLPSNHSYQLHVIAAHPLHPCYGIVLSGEQKPKASKRRYFWIFVLGGVFGLLVAGFFVGQSDLELSHWKDLNLDSLMDVLPAGLVRDAKDLQVRLLACGSIAIQCLQC